MKDITGMGIGFLGGMAFCFILFYPERIGAFIEGETARSMAAQKTVCEMNRPRNQVCEATILWKVVEIK